MACLLLSGRLDGYSTGPLTLQFGAAQIGGAGATLLLSISSIITLLSTARRARQELNRRKAEARGQLFHDPITNWDDWGHESPFILLLKCGQTKYERVGLFIWYFIFGFGTIGMYIYNEQLEDQPGSSTHDGQAMWVHQLRS